jgi:glycosyltransferase involved in cell wall biosynthesis
VGRDRGIENIVKAMGILRDYKIQCTLLGNASDEMRKHFVEVAQHSGLNADQLIFVNPVSLTEMFKIGAQHHIGMATEPGHNENNRRALSNKIFSYLLSGLAIVASNTPAQLSFINEYPSVGCYYNRDSPEGLAAALESYLKNPDQLDEARNYALHLATTTLNWENESKKIVAIVETVLGKDSFRKAGKTVTAV